jgi:hypothetical protein
MARSNISIGALCVLLSAAFLMAAAKPLGTWECSSSTPGGDERKWTLTVQELDGKLVGTVGGEEGDIPIEDAKFENDTLTFKVTLDTGTYQVTLKIDGDKLDGSWTGGGISGTVKGSKKA